MSMSNNIKHQVVHKFTAKRSRCPKKTAKLNSFVSPEWEKQQTYRKYVIHSVLR